MWCVTQENSVSKLKFLRCFQLVLWFDLAVMITQTIGIPIELQTFKRK